MEPADLKELFRHMEWADAEVWRVVLATPLARTDHTLRGLLLHMHVVQRAFLDLWENRSAPFPELATFPDASDIHAWAVPYYASVHAFAEALTDDALRRPVTVPWAEELGQQLGLTPFTPSLADTMIQVTSHSTYHRGQINMRLRQLGGEPPLVDYIAWIWFGRPTYGSPMRRS